MGLIARLSAGVAAALLLLAARSGEGVVAYVTDGDTFRLTSGERIRIAGIDAPETHRDHARCAVEIARGDAARTEAKALLDGRAVRLVRVGRSYNRTVARVSVGGRDLGELLVASGAARWWPRHTPKPDWCGAGNTRATHGRVAR